MPTSSPSSSTTAAAASTAATAAGPAAAPATSRRHFLKQAVLATGMLALPTFIPAAALGRDGKTAPSNRVVIGGVGYGRRAEHDMGRWFLRQPDVQFVAACDVRDSRRRALKARVDQHNGNSDCKTYVDMDEMFARPDIDAIVTATGDRLHATVSIRAMRAGKDVYSEKPATLTIAEGQELVRAARAYARVYQAGMQRLSERNFIFCEELARSGRLGEIKAVHAHLAPISYAGNVGVRMNRKWLPGEPLPDPAEVDWDRWLGPCPWRPYNARYVNGGWHGQHDFYTSVIGEWGSHTFASCQAALDLGDTSPVHFPYVKHPTADGLTMRFANGVVMRSLHQDTWRDAAGNTHKWRGTCSVRYIGTEGWCATGDGYSAPDLSDPTALGDLNKVVQHYLLRTGRELDHVRNFLACVKSRREAAANPTLTHRTMSTVHCANIAQWLGRDLTWDPVKEEFVNDDEANRLRSRDRREGWEIADKPDNANAGKSSAGNAAKPTATTATTAATAAVAANAAKVNHVVALRGTLLSAAPGRLPLWEKAIASADPADVATALRVVLESPTNAAATAAFACVLVGLPADTQARLAEVLGARGDKAAADALVVLLKKHLPRADAAATANGNTAALAANAAVRYAVARALVPLGKTAVAEATFNHLLSAKDAALAAAAREALRGLFYQTPAAETAAGFKPLFNGKDLTGWRDPDGWWTVDNGILTAESTAEKPCKKNSHLLWDGGAKGDFELRAEFRLSRSANSGIQFRAADTNADTSYQADMNGTGEHVGFLYHPSFHLVGKRGARVVLRANGKTKATRFADAAVLGAHIYKPGTWAEYRIIAAGKNIALYVNGIKTAAFVDERADAPKTGHITLQMHAGPPMKIEYRNLRLRDL